MLKEPPVRDQGQNPILQFVPDGPATTQQRRYFGVLKRLLYVDVAKNNPAPFLALPTATYLNLNCVGTTVRTILCRALAAAVCADVGRIAMRVEWGGLGRQINKFRLVSDLIPEDFGICALKASRAFGVVVLCEQILGVWVALKK